VKQSAKTSKDLFKGCLIALGEIFVTYRNIHLAIVANEVHFCDYCRKIEQFLFV